MLPQNVAESAGWFGFLGSMGEEVEPTEFCGRHEQEPVPLMITMDMENDMVGLGLINPIDGTTFYSRCQVINNAPYLGRGKCHKSDYWMFGIIVESGELPWIWIAPPILFENSSSIKVLDLWLASDPDTGDNPIQMRQVCDELRAPNPCGALHAPVNAAEESCILFPQSGKTRSARDVTVIITDNPTKGREAPLATLRWPA